MDIDDSDIIITGSQTTRLSRKQVSRRSNLLTEPPAPDAMGRGRGLPEGLTGRGTLCSPRCVSSVDSRAAVALTGPVQPRLCTVTTDGTGGHLHCTETVSAWVAPLCRIIRFVFLPWGFGTGQ